MFLFSFTSIQTRWQQNVITFEVLEPLFRHWKDVNEKLVCDVIKSCGSGMHNKLAENLCKFHRVYWNNPKDFRQHSCGFETMGQFRDRLEKAVDGLGLAKSSFTIELAHPEDCEVVCIDTWIKQFFGLDKKLAMTATLYKKMEEHWNECCKKRRVPSAILRHIYWDKLRGKTNTRYWSHVLERK